MIYEQNVRIPSSEKIVKHTVASCLKCGCDDINISEYEDQYGYITTVSCKNIKCKNEVKINAGEVGGIKEWNKKNYIPTLIRDKKKLVAKTQSEIKALMKLKKNR